MPHAREGAGIMAEERYYTLKGYSVKNGGGISPAMEDYLEMICRSVLAEEFIRVNTLAERLNVSPPSSSKMVSRLRERGLVDFERYGIIRLTPEGQRLGAYLLHRHAVLHAFFCAVNGTDDALELVEKIEHFIDADTVANLEALLPAVQKLRDAPGLPADGPLLSADRADK